MLGRAAHTPAPSPRPGSTATPTRTAQPRGVGLLGDGHGVGRPGRGRALRQGRHRLRAAHQRPHPGRQGVRGGHHRRRQHHRDGQPRRQRDRPRFVLLTPQANLGWRGTCGTPPTHGRHHHHPHQLHPLQQHQDRLAAAGVGLPGAARTALPREIQACVSAPRGAMAHMVRLGRASSGHCSGSRVAATARSTPLRAPPATHQRGVHAMTASTDTKPTTTKSSSRRALLAGALGGLGAVAAGAIGQGQPGPRRGRRRHRASAVTH